MTMPREKQGLAVRCIIMLMPVHIVAQNHKLHVHVHVHVPS